jgi:hypothetical protein
MLRLAVSHSFAVSNNTMASHHARHIGRQQSVISPPSRAQLKLHQVHKLMQNEKETNMQRHDQD